MSSVIEVQIEDRVGIIKLNRPDSLNAFNNELSDALYSQIEEFNESSDEEILASKDTDSSGVEDSLDKGESKESTNEDAEPKKKRFSLFKRKKKS